jgi:hypothetical protein
MFDKPPNPYSKLHTNFTTRYVPESKSGEEKLRYATQRTIMLLGCYRQGEASDPKVYVRAVAAVLAHYDEAVITAVTDPVRGLPGSTKWLPNVAEVRAACEAELRPSRDYEERKRRVEEERLLLTNTSTCTPEERERAFEHWVRNIRPELEAAQRSKPRWEPRPLEEQLADSLPKLSEYAKMSHEERAEKIMGIMMLTPGVDLYL